MNKIALPVTEGNTVNDHFGHCEKYLVFTVSENQEIEKIVTVPAPNECGCKSDIAGILSAIGVKTMLAGGIGNGAVQVLHAHGIKVIRGCAGDAAEVVRSYVTGTLTDSGENCSHHEHHHEHHHTHGDSCHHNH